MIDDYNAEFYDNSFHQSFSSENYRDWMAWKQYIVERKKQKRED